MIYYAVREIGTDNYLPQVYPRRLTNCSSYSHYEPTPETELMPRLHRNRVTAERCLTGWLKGIQYADGRPPSRVDNRQRSKMEIVMMNLESL